MMRYNNNGFQTAIFESHQIHKPRLGHNWLLCCVLLCFPSLALSQVFPTEMKFEEVILPHGSSSKRDLLLTRVNAHNQIGDNASDVGDINGDGISDFGIVPDGGYFTTIIDNAYVNNRLAYVVFGQENGFPTDLKLRNLLSSNGGDGTQGFVLNGISPSEAEFGFRPCISKAGDFNGDGINDLLYGDPGEDGGHRGTVFVIFGRRGIFPPEFKLRTLLEANGGSGTQGIVLHSRNIGSTGNSVSPGGDVNGDGLDDILIGNAAANGGQGEAYILFGRSIGFPPEMYFANLFSWNGGDGTQGVVLKGIGGHMNRGNEYLTGWDVMQAGDINNDGLTDILLTAPGADPTGATYVVFGRAYGFPPIIQLTDLPEQDTVDLSHGSDNAIGFSLNRAISKTEVLNSDILTKSDRQLVQNSTQFE